MKLKFFEFPIPRNNLKEKDKEEEILHFMHLDIILDIIVQFLDSSRYAETLIFFYRSKIDFLFACNSQQIDAPRMYYIRIHDNDC